MKPGQRSIAAATLATLMLTSTLLLATRFHTRLGLARRDYLRPPLAHRATP